MDNLVKSKTGLFQCNESIDINLELIWTVKSVNLNAWAWVGCFYLNLVFVNRTANSCWNYFDEKKFGLSLLLFGFPRKNLLNAGP